VLSDFFYIRKSDRRAILFILCVIVVAFMVILFTDSRMDTTPEYAADSTLYSQRSTLHAPRSTIYAQPSTLNAQRFPFDPNTADSTQLLRLGLRPWQVRNIYKYRARGGVYRKKEDFARLYGLTVKEYRELEPYIRISSDYVTPAATLVEEEEHYERDTLKYPIKVEVPSSINLNTADTLQLRKVPGVGEAFARRIISYGQRLGGYVSPEQLREIEDFPADAIPYFVVNRPNIRKINVNQLTLNQLQRHPYISFYQAKAIMEYRRLRGPLQSLDDLKLHRDFPPEAINRLKPYVEF
jgi:DNA uptake protein ComE-like DNA-binding protein